MIALFPSRTVALELFGLSIHWYGIMYLLAFLLAAGLLPRLQRFRRLELKRDEWLNLLTWAILGVIVGGRLGYVFFYQPVYFLSHPLSIPAVWEGGMAFHGGLIGVSLVLAWMCKQHGRSMLAVADIVAVPAALGLALGRLGNFINLELYGSVTTLPWGIAIPGVEGLRHPTQLYECGYSLVIALLCFLHLRFAPTARPGWTFALFLFAYGVFRSLTELLRVQEYVPLTVGPLVLTRGQLLSVPMILCGVGLWIWLRGAETSLGGRKA